MKSLKELEQKIKDLPSKRIGLIAAEDKDSIKAVFDAYNKQLVEPILIGNEKQIKQICEELNYSLDSITIYNYEKPEEAANFAVELAKKGEINVFMKGLISTKDYLRPILKKENGLVSGILSHVALFELEHYHKPLMITDAALNIKPTVKEKIQIIKNAADVCYKLGIERPKIAYICAVEKVNPEKMPETEEAAILTQMAKRHQLGNIDFDGPLALDNAVSRHSVEVKKIDTTVGGDADVLVFPEIIAANVAYKSLAYLAGAAPAATIAGSKIPIVLTSRADSDLSKFYSILISIAIS